ncbi:MAG: DUF2147 domain-containing protein [Paludibacteraceae bacterium]
MKKALFVLLALCATFSATAQVNQILGNWRTIDDKSGEPQSIVHIYKGSDGLYYGRIIELLVDTDGQDALCVACEGEDYNQPVVGMVIIRGMHEEDGCLKGGRVLDPDNGKFYYGKIYLEKGNLVLRGSLDKRGFLGRNQTWLRVE